VNVVERNKAALDYVNEKLLSNEKWDDTVNNLIPNFGDVDKMLRMLIFQKVDGFRGITLTSIVGMYLDPTFDPITNFYGCNPRSIFEKGIWYALTENNIPTGKSSPLNVAKNINQLDAGWIQGKRPIGAAKAAVDFLTILVASKGTDTYDRLVNYFFHLLNEYAREIGSISVDTKNIDQSSSLEISDLVIEFTLSYPESGSVPQKVVGVILKIMLESNGRRVCGAEESVFGTNTTSKKPADIWTEQADGKYDGLFEVTVKAVDHKRLDDNIDSLDKLGILGENNVVYICRVSEDTQELGMKASGKFSYRNVPFDFLDIREFIRSNFAIMTQEQIKEFMESMTDFIGDVNRKQTTKQGWNSIMGTD